MNKMLLFVFFGILIALLPIFSGIRLLILSFTLPNDFTLFVYGLLCVLLGFVTILTLLIA